MPVRASDLRELVGLLSDYESYLTQLLNEARIDALILERLRTRLLNIQIEINQLIRNDSPEAGVIINNYFNTSNKNNN